MEDLILKLPRHWQGVIAALSVTQKAVLSGQCWLRQQTQLSWCDLLMSLSQEEPVIDRNETLSFKPRLFLFPADIQRNLLSFIQQQREDIQTQDLKNFVESIQEHSVQDRWINCLVLELSQSLHSVTGSGFANLEYYLSPDLSTLCKQINNSKQTIHQFDWLSQYVAKQHAKSKNECAEKDEDRVSGEFGNGSEAKIEMKNVNTKENKMNFVEEDDRFDENVHDGIIQKVTADKCVISAAPSHMIDGVIVIDSSSEEEMPVDMETDIMATKDEVVMNDVSMETDTNSQELDNDVKVSADKLKDILQSMVVVDGSHVQVPPELDVFTKYTSQVVERICTYLELSTLPESTVYNLTQAVCHLQPEPSFSNSCIIAACCFLPKLQDLQQTASRTMMSAVMNFSEKFPRPIIDGVLVPICSHLGSPQSDIICRLARETFSSDMRVCLYRKLCEIDMEWTVSTSHVFQTLLDLKVELDNETLNKFLNLLEHHGVACQKCLKFGKVLVTAVNKYGKQFSQGHISTMSRILDVNKTYLKKTATTALKKL